MKKTAENLFNITDFVLHTSLLLIHQFLLKVFLLTVCIHRANSDENIYSY